MSCADGLAKSSLPSSPALRTLRHSYLLREGNAIFERPQHFWLRIALQTHQSDQAAVQVCYDLMSTFRYIPASPTLLNSGSEQPHLLSSFLLPTYGEPDNVFKQMQTLADVTREGGSVGVGMQNYPARG